MTAKPIPVSASATATIPRQGIARAARLLVTKRPSARPVGKDYGSFDPANHTGTLSGWKTNGTEHWKEYNCCHAEVQRARHSFTAEAEQEAYLKSAATCTERADVFQVL